jgi:hypothetical protein
LLEIIVKQCIAKGLIKSSAIILDSTHSLAASQKQKPLEVLRNASKRLLRTVIKKHPKLEKKFPPRPALTKDQPDTEKVMLHYLAELGESVESFLPHHEGAISEKLAIAKQIVEDERLLANKGVMSAIDPDARFGWKSNTKSFFGYKSHIAMTEEEMITAVEVTGGSHDDGKQLTTLLERSLATGVNVFEYNKDADFVICPAGEHSTRKAVQGSKESGHSRSLVFYFDVEKCKTCPLREDCYKEDAKSKTYSIRIIADHYKEHMIPWFTSNANPSDPHRIRRQCKENNKAKRKNAANHMR